MRRILPVLFFVLALSSFGQSLLAQNAYGWNLHDATDPEAVGPCRIDVRQPEKTTILRKHDFGICAGAFAGKKYYAYTYRSAAGASEPIAFGAYDFETGVFTQIADYSRMQTLFYDMTYDYKNGVMYALGIDGENSTLLTVDLSTGRITKLANLSQRFLTLAADLQGQLYAEDTYGYLTKIGTNGAEEALNGGDYSPMSNFQSMTFEHTSEHLYWVIPTNREGTQLLYLDNISGYVKTNAALPNERQIVGLDFPFSTVKDGAPGEIKSLAIIPASSGELRADISISTPDKTSGNAVLGNFSVHLFRNGVEIKVFSGLTPGATVTYEDLVPADALYTYKAFARNTVGSSEEISRQAYIGEDLPNSVSEITIEKIGSTGCRISWKAPTGGIHGGYIPQSISYNLLRLPGNTPVATGLNSTNYTDESITGLNNYRYRIIPQTKKGAGASAESNNIILGNAIKPPYTCEFTDGEFVFWKVIDVNKDNTTWKRDTGNSGVYCSFADSKGDDLLISPPIMPEAGKRYKLVVTASSYDRDTPEKMGLFLGKGQDGTQMNTLLGDFVVSNEEGGRNDYTVYFSAGKPATEFNIGIWMHSDPDMFHLTVYRLALQEAKDGNISGTVTFAEVPMADAVVQLTGTDYRTITGETGRWQMPNIPEGEYTLVIRKDGFAEVEARIVVVDGENPPHDTQLKKLRKIRATGKTTYDAGKALSEAKIELYKPEAEKPLYTAFSNKAGVYSLDNIYEGRYRAKISRAGLVQKVLDVDLTPEHSAIQDVQLEDKIVAPRYVNAIPNNEGGMTVSWLSPTDTDTLSYCYGPGVARLGVEEHGTRSILGTVFRKDMALTKVKWKTSDHRGPHTRVDLVVFALDADGEPTKTILFEQSDIENKDNEWTSFEFESPVVVKGGALVALRYNGYLSLLADGGESAGSTFEKHVHLLNKDYETSPFEYLDKHNLEKNYLLGVEFSSLDSRGEPEETLQRAKGFKVFRSDVTKGAGTATSILVGESGIGTLMLADKSWHTLPAGYYRYAVKAVFGDGNLSSGALSKVSGKDLTTTIYFEIETNAGKPDSEAVIELVRKEDKQQRYSAQIDASGRTVVENLPKGIYHLSAELDGFEKILLSNISLEKENQYVQKLNFIERLLPAYNLKVLPGANPFERKLTWNEDNYIFDDFDSYKAFTLEPATPERNWLYWDSDKAETIEFNEIRFPHMGEAMSFIVFNPTQTDPKISMTDKASLAYSGNQYLAAFANRKGACRNYLFSPILKFSGSAVLAMQARSFTNQSGPEVLRIGYTNTEYPKTEKDILWLGDEIRLSDKGWQRLEQAVPNDAKRLVIAHLSDDTFFCMIDNLFIGEPCPYADGSIAKPARNRASYTVRLDGRIFIESTIEHELLLENLTPGEHTAEVVAVYVSGRSVRETKTFNVENDDAVNLPQEERIFIYPNPTSGRVNISTEVDHWQIFSAKGESVLSGKSQTIDLGCRPKGFYFIKLTKGNRSKVSKLYVK